MTHVAVTVNLDGYTETVITVDAREDTPLSSVFREVEPQVAMLVKKHQSIEEDAA